MPRNGAGNYSLVSGNPVTTGATISSTTHNNTLSDISNALTESLAKDGQTTPTANLPMGGYAHTGVGDATARTQYAKVSQVQDGGYVALSSVLGTDTITATCAPAITAYAAGQSFKFTAAGANTGAVTLNINSLGAKAVTKEGTAALAAGDIASGAVVWVDYDGTRFQLTSGRSVQPLDATLTALAGVLTAANKIPYATALNTAGELDLSTNTSLGTSDTTLSSQKAVKTYADTKNIATQVTPGTSGNVLTSDGSAWVSRAPFGTAWVDSTVTPGRAVNTTYTNSLSRPLLVYVQGTYSSGANTTWTVGGVTGIGYVSNAQVNPQANSTFMVVPAGATYRLVVGGGSVSSVVWFEL